MSDKSWVFDNINKQQAIQILEQNHTGDGSYLIRKNLINSNEYILYVYKSGKIQYYLIKSEYNYIYINRKYKFYDLEDLVEHYMNNSGLTTYLRYAVDKSSLKNSLTQIKKDIFKIDRGDISLFEKIGSGYYGDVFRGEHKVTKQQVAVKKLKNGFNQKIVDDEAEFMMKLQNLQALQHKNIVKFVGTCRDYSDNSILIVTEFVKYGALYYYLINYKYHIKNSTNPFQRLLNMAIDICDGMRYLEANNILHRDLACRNCLVGSNEVVKVCDFGMARITSNNFYQADPSKMFPVKWSAPEVLLYKSFSNKSDVWSFGCCMYEIFSFGKIPYGYYTSDHVAHKQITTGVVPERPNYATSSLYDDLMLKCWKKDPKERPSFSELKTMLKRYKY